MPDTHRIPTNPQSGSAVESVTGTSCASTGEATNAWIYDERLALAFGAVEPLLRGAGKLLSAEQILLSRR